MEPHLYKIKLTGNVDLMKKAKKLSSIGLSKADGVAIYRTVSLKTKSEVEEYLKDLKIEFVSVSKLGPVMEGR